MELGNINDVSADEVARLSGPVTDAEKAVTEALDKKGIKVFFSDLLKKVTAQWKAFAVKVRRNAHGRKINWTKVFSFFFHSLMACLDVYFVNWMAAMWISTALIGHILIVLGFIVVIRALLVHLSRILRQFV